MNSSLWLHESLSMCIAGEGSTTQVTVKTFTWARDAWLMKSTGCSSRWPKVWFSAGPWWPITTCSFSSRGSDTLLWPSEAPSTHMAGGRADTRSGKVPTYINSNKGQVKRITGVQRQPRLLKGVQGSLQQRPSLKKQNEKTNCPHTPHPQINQLTNNNKNSPNKTCPTPRP